MIFNQYKTSRREGHNLSCDSEYGSDCECGINEDFGEWIILYKNEYNELIYIGMKKSLDLAIENVKLLTDRQIFREGVNEGRVSDDYSQRQGCYYYIGNYMIFKTSNEQI